MIMRLELGAFEGPANLDPQVGVADDCVPKGEVELACTSDVFSADGHRVGRVGGFVGGGDEAITHVVLTQHHLFGPGEATVPIDAIARVSTDSVTLGLT